MARVRAKVIPSERESEREKERAVCVESLCVAYVSCGVMVVMERMIEN